jgi:hypothetical protein
MLLGSYPCSIQFFSQFHIHGTECVWYYFWFHSEDKIDIEIQYYQFLERMGIWCSHGRECEHLIFLECSLIWALTFWRRENCQLNIMERDTMPLILFANIPSLSFLSRKNWNVGEWSMDLGRRRSCACLTY